MTFERKWSMPNSRTFNIPPIGELLRRYITPNLVVIDPFSNGSKYGTLRNDLDPETDSDYHMRATEFMEMLKDKETVADVILFDPPYSPRQISECYGKAGLKATMKDTQNARLYAEVKQLGAAMLRPSGVAISCGWNTCGFGITRGFKIEHILLVCHGGAHNDTIVTVERKIGTGDGQ